MNHALEILHSLTERFAGTATVKQVFGEPIETQGKTIEPVARVIYNVGAGWGGPKAEMGEGGSGGAVRWLRLRRACASNDSQIWSRRESWSARDLCWGW